MGFFETLRRVLGKHEAEGEPAGSDARGSSGDDARATPYQNLPAVDPSHYDRNQWHKKLKRILSELPASQYQWAELMSESRALNLDPEWVTKCQVDEFLLLVRRAVADRHFTEEEHRKLDLARALIGIPEAEAEATLHTIIAEAESFFGKSIEGG
jgi:hypothetical protein